MFLAAMVMVNALVVILKNKKVNKDSMGFADLMATTGVVYALIYDFGITG